jgi:hypothetical protein
MGSRLMVGVMRSMFHAGGSHESVEKQKAA